MAVTQGIVDALKALVTVHTDESAKLKILADLIAAEAGSAPNPVPPNPVPGTDDPNDNIPAGFPYAGNTGPRVAVTDASPGIIVAGAILTGKRFRGSINVTAANVTLRDCEILGNSYWAIKTRADTTLENCLVDGAGVEGCHGVMGGGIVKACKIQNVENGITGQMNGGRASDNLIWKLRSAGSPHYDGVQMDGGLADWIFDHNTILVDYNQTAAVMIDNYFGPISNIRVNNCFLKGGGYTVYSDGQFNGGAIGGVQFTNNLMAKGQWGFKSINNNTVTWTNNKSVTFDGTGKPIIGAVIP